MMIPATDTWKENRRNFLAHIKSEPETYNIILEACRRRAEDCRQRNIWPIRAHATSIYDDARDAGASGLIRDFMPLYSRMIMRRHEELWGIFNVNEIGGESSERLAFFRGPWPGQDARPPK